MIDWCQKDSFWNANILSAKKLREKFDVMVRQANRKSTFNNRSKGRIEKLPEHIKNPPKQAEMTAEEEAELNRKLAKYLDKGSD